MRVIASVELCVCVLDRMVVWPAEMKQDEQLGIPSGSNRGALARPLPGAGSHGPQLLAPLRRHAALAREPSRPLQVFALAPALASPGSHTKIMATRAFQPGLSPTSPSLWCCRTCLLVFSCSVAGNRRLLVLHPWPHLEDYRYRGG